MNKIIVSLVVVLVALVSVMNCDRFGNEQQPKRSMIGGVGGDGGGIRELLTRNAHHPQRSKRRLQDVEKLMVEDEVMSYLICEVCEKHTCDPKYCRFCSQCILNFNKFNG